MPVAKPGKDGRFLSADCGGNHVCTASLRRDEPGDAANAWEGLFKPPLKRLEVRQALFLGGRMAAKCSVALMC
jgi:hypothetical protein